MPPSNKNKRYCSLRGQTIAELQCPQEREETSKNVIIAGRVLILLGWRESKKDHILLKEVVREWIKQVLNDWVAKISINNRHQGGRA
jgi:hypothetical protein